MKIAVVNSTVRGETDRLISTAAALLQERGVQLAGIVKELGAAAGCDDDCDMQVRVLPDGPLIAITQALGKGSDACRLDPSAIATAVAEVERRPLDQAQVFLLNKFGPEEAEGRGFCAMIGAALERGIPVVVGVGGPNRTAFDAFAQGMAEDLPLDEQAIVDWCVAAMKQG